MPITSQQHASMCEQSWALESAEYIRLLEQWSVSMAQWTHTVQNQPELAYYGTGGHEHWAIQAQCTAFAAVAVLATALELDEARLGCSRDTLRARALQMLRYIYRTHKSGGQSCVSGQSWGHSWISSLGLERCAHGIAVLRPWLTADDLAGLRAMMISESAFLLDGYPVTCAIDGSMGLNKPESNIWNGAMLYRTAMLFPDAPHAGQYRDKATALLLNGISIPADADADTPYAGKALRDWHVGPNFTENYGLHHHGYLNLGYMAICLSNIAMLHYFCRDYGIAAPPELYHHANELWRLVKSLTFDDGRLWRIGGDTRVRYCYCQDYAIPTWMLAGELWDDDDADRFATNWRGLVAKEQAGNADGGFFSGRLASLARVSPLYYCRLEGDRALSLSMGAYWMRQRRACGSPSAPLAQTAMSAWHDDFHGAAMVRGKRLASWVWKGAQLPGGTIVPADRSDMVEWQWNLAGRISGTGCTVKAEVVQSTIDVFDGGFVSTGCYQWIAANNPAEGMDAERTAQARTVFVALPDDSTVVVVQQARTLKPVYLAEVAGLYLNVPNDLYNDGQRTYRIDGAERVIAGAGGAHTPVAETIACGSRLGVDGRLHVQAIHGGSLALQRPGARRVNLHHNVPLSYSGEGASLYCDVVCLPYADELAFYEQDTPLYDISVAIAVDAEPRATLLSPADAAGKVIEIMGADSHRYLLAVNMGECPLAVSLPGEAALADVLHGARPTASATGAEVVLDSGAVVLLYLPG